MGEGKPVPVLLEVPGADVSGREQLEELLRASEERFRNVFLHNPDAVAMTHESDGRYVSINPAFTRTLGYSPDEILGKTSLEVGIWVDREDRNRLISGVTSQGWVENLEIRFRCRDGSCRTTLASSAAIDIGGEPHLLTIVRDITGRRRMEDAQRFLLECGHPPSGEGFFEALARFLAETLRMDFVCIDRLEGNGLDARTVAVWCDGLFQDNVTYALRDTPCGDVVGKAVCCFPANVCQFFPRDEVLRDLRAESYVGVTLFGHTGKPIGLIAVIGRNPLADREAAEAILQLVGTRAAAELERKAAEDALRKSEETYRGLFDHMKNGSAFCRMLYEDGRPVDWIYLKVNRAFEEQTGLVGVAGMRASEVIPGIRETSADLIETYGRVALTGRPENFETWVEALKDWYSVSVYSPERDHFVAVFDVVTRRKRAEARIRELNEELERRVVERTAELEAAVREMEAFSYSVSHDLRAPLRAIEGFSGMLVRDAGDRLTGEDQRRLEVVRTNARTMSWLIDDLLTFSRTSRSEIQLGRVRMEPIAQLAFDEVVGDSTDRAKIDFRLGSLPDATGDHRLLRQVWVNVLSNAVKFSQRIETPLVEVDGAVEGDLAVYRVRDNGVGFDPRYKDKLFGVFQRLHGQTEFEGTGIGLALVKRIVEKHGGRVWAEGELDKGATFHFSLPVTKESGANLATT